MKDIPPSEHTKKQGTREACWNNRSPRSQGHYAMDRYYYPNGKWTLRLEYVEDRMSDPCGQRKGMNPPGCEGCEELQ